MDLEKLTMDKLVEERTGLARAIRENERDVEELDQKMARVKRSLARKRRKAGAIRDELRRRTPQNPAKSGERSKVLSAALSHLCQSVASERGVSVSAVADEALSIAREKLGVRE